MLKLEEVHKLHTSLQEAYDQGSENEGCSLSFKQLEDILDCIQWTAVQLNQRRVNSRKYLTKQKVVNKLIKEHLSKDEMDEIDEQARRAAEGEEEGE